MKVKRERRIAEVIVDMFAELPEKEVADQMKEVVEYLANHHLLGSARKIATEVEKVWKRRFGASKVTIISAHHLPGTVREHLEKVLPNAEIAETMEVRLLGGAVIRMDDVEIDGSAVGALARLKRELL